MTMNYQDHYQSLAQTPMHLTRPLGVIEISGTSRLDLIDRMSTQKVKGLRSGEGAATVFTTDIGRIIDRVILYAGDDKITAVTGANNGENMIRYLMRYVFFNDDFHMRDLSQEMTAVSVYGATAGVVIESLFDTAVATRDKHHWASAKFNDTPITIHKADPIHGDGYLVLLPQTIAPQLNAALMEAGSQEATRELFGYCRVVAGLPLLGFEMTGDYIPLETGLWDDVSFNKGCYIGQEIIARMESRGRIAKKLVKLEATQELSRGAAIQADGKTVGAITSTLAGMALGYVKSGALDGGTPLASDGVPLIIRP